MAKIRTVSTDQLAGLANMQQSSSILEHIGLAHHAKKRSLPVGSERRNNFVSSAAYHLDQAHDLDTAVKRQHFSGPGTYMDRTNTGEPGQN